ncbi:MAG: hypothetical protein WBP17_04965, partial [Gemmatimonadota bacterium]
MRLRLHPILEPDWPALAWIARCERSNPVITVRHGPQVETRENWMCEAALNRMAGEWPENGRRMAG